MCNFLNEIESNLIHGRARDSSFLQRMSDPEVAVVDGVSYYLQPDSIEVGSKVYVREHLKLSLIHISEPTRPY